jgi:outer membrane biosynthesis protein TonB
MRISEITDAQGQLELLRTVIDNTWTAIAQQAEQEKRAEAEHKAQAKLKPRAKKSGKGTSIRIPTPPPPPNKKPQAPLAKQPPSPLNKPNPNALNAVNPQPSTNPQLKQQSTNTSVNPKLAFMSQPKPTATTPIKQHYGVKDGYFGKNIGTTEKDDEGDDRYSKNGIATLKK